MNNNLTLHDWQCEIHNLAVEKGWHGDKEKTHGEYNALFQSEISEAFNEYMSGHFKSVYYSSNQKPEGFFIEIADLIIRILDYLAEYKQNAQIICELMKCLYQTNENIINTEIFLLSLHKIISTSIEAIRMEKYEASYAILGFAIVYAITYAESNDIDMYEMISIKHEYNLKRSYRHGNKTL